MCKKSNSKRTLGERTHEFFNEQVRGTNTDQVLAYLLDRLDRGTERLECLTRVLIVLTAILSVLTIILVIRAW